jgi:hypothetical protein
MLSGHSSAQEIKHLWKLTIVLLDLKSPILREVSVCLGDPNHIKTKYIVISLTRFINHGEEQHCGIYYFFSQIIYIFCEFLMELFISLNSQEENNPVSANISIF